MYRDHFRSRRKSQYRGIKISILILTGLILSYLINAGLSKKSVAPTPNLESHEIALPQLPHHIINEVDVVKIQPNPAPHTVSNAKSNATSTTKNNTVSTKSNTSIEVTKPPEIKSKAVQLKAGESLSSVFKRLNLNHSILQKILRNVKETDKKHLTNLKTNQKLEFFIKDNNLEKLIIPINVKENLVISLNAKNEYEANIQKQKITTQDTYVSATISGSIYKTAKKLNIPYKLISQMNDIFTWELDFTRDVKAGDKFTILYKSYYIEDKLIDIGDILAVTYKNRNKTYTAIRHKRKNGTYEYFNENGQSLTKAFDRYPLKFSHISSPFSLSRLHPVLNVKRPHKGVDLAAPLGTPIKATGDGRIKLIEAVSGYGNMVKIDHNKKYSTVYAHLLKFKKGLSVGSYVKRGDIIGYVGQTGTATGPHCHYEFHINKQPKNPTTVDLPKADPVPKIELAQFKANALNRLASMKLYEEAKFASSEKRESSAA